MCASRFSDTSSVELLAPAGSFDAAIKAIEAGADAIYFGLPLFSARQAARNFDITQLRRLISAREQTGARLYLTVNTLIHQRELKQALRMTEEALSYGVDAVIVQDFGFAELLKKLIPDIELHASTQMAIHNVEGVRIAEEQGFSRVVLARELTPEQVGIIADSVPNVELEVFVHGALCYSFSGICLASGMEADRSANRGQCAQFCRSRYTMEGMSEGFFFSCRDLALHEEIAQYIAAGAKSLKIEGRMKSPSYVYHTTALYRSILDGHADIEQKKTDSAIVFSRKSGMPYLITNSGEELIESEHPGHQGVFLGSVGRITKRGCVVTVRHPISLHDGILFFIDDNPMHPFKGAVQSLFVAGKAVRFCKADSRVEMVLKQRPHQGAQLFLVSSRNLDVPLPKEGAYPLVKRAVSIRCTLNTDTITLEVPDYDVVWSHRVLTVEPSNHADRFEETVRRIFKKSGNASFYAEQVAFVGNTAAYISPSELKQLRTQFFSAFEQAVDNRMNEQIAVLSEQSIQDRSPLWSETELSHYADRGRLNPKTPELDNSRDLIPFAFTEHLTHSERLARVNGYMVVPLLPILPESGEYVRTLRSLLAKKDRPPVLIGISNVAHLEIIREIPQDSVRYFLDFPAYITNEFSFDFWAQSLPTPPLFGYHWVESDIDESFVSSLPLVVNVNRFAIPLFNATGCLEKSLHENRCYSNCPRSFVRHFENGGKQYCAVTYHCLTFTFRIR